MKFKHGDKVRFQSRGLRPIIEGYVTETEHPGQDLLTPIPNEIMIIDNIFPGTTYSVGVKRVEKIDEFQEQLSKEYLEDVIQRETRTHNFLVKCGQSKVPASKDPRIKMFTDMLNQLTDKENKQ